MIAATSMSRTTAPVSWPPPEGDLTVEIAWKMACTFVPVDDQRILQRLGPGRRERPAPRYTPEDLARCMPRYSVERGRLWDVVIREDSQVTPGRPTNHRPHSEPHGE